MKYSHHPLSNLSSRLLELVTIFFLVLGMNAIVFAASSEEQLSYEPVVTSSPEVAMTDTTMEPDEAQPQKNPKTSPPKKEEPQDTAPPAAQPPSTAAAPAPKPASSSATVSASSGYSFVNNLRAENGKSTITRDSTLEQSATAYAKSLANGCKDLIHIDLSTLLGIKISGGTTTSAAENVALNSSVSGALTSLENSPGHFANMIGPYTHIGIGAAVSNNPACAGSLYLVMHFAGV